MRLHRLTLAALLLVAGAARPAVASSHGAPAAEAVEEAQPEGAVRLGRFDIRDHRPVEGVKLRLGFTIYLEVDPADATALRKLVKAREHRIRQEVIVVVRTCEPADFEEPELERFRRRLVVRLRRTMPELKAEKVLVGQYEYFTQ